MAGKSKVPHTHAAPQATKPTAPAPDVVVTLTHGGRSWTTTGAKLALALGYAFGRPRDERFYQRIEGLVQRVCDATLLTFVYGRRRGGGWDDPEVVGQVLEGLGLAAELISEQRAALAIDEAEVARIFTALGAATADYAGRLVAGSRADTIADATVVRFAEKAKQAVA